MDYKSSSILIPDFVSQIMAILLWLPLTIRILSGEKHTLLIESIYPSKDLPFLTLFFNIITRLSRAYCDYSCSVLRKIYKKDPLECSPSQKIACLSLFL